MSQIDPIFLPSPLLPATAYEITLRIGLVPETDHAQWSWKVEDPTVDQLVGMGSCPHVSLATIHRLSSVLVTSILDAVFADLEPF